MMNRTFLLLCTISSLLLGTFSCNRPSKSELLYQRAESALQAKEYQKAQRILDSIPTGGFYSSEWRHKGIILNQRITLEENRRNLAYIDSLLPSLYKIREALLPMFRYVQDSLYQDEGYYIYYDDKEADDLRHSSLRVQITPDYEGEIVSIYCGKNPLRHVSAKVELADGSYALTPTIACDNVLNYCFQFPDGYYSELVSYTGRELRPVFELISSSNEQPVKISYEGDFPYSYMLSENDREAFKKSWQLIALQKYISNIEEEKEATEKIIELLLQQLSNHEDDLLSSKNKGKGLSIKNIVVSLPRN